jgi:hypothetical protein
MAQPQMYLTAAGGRWLVCFSCFARVGWLPLLSVSGRMRRLSGPGPSDQ